jgi:plasmid stabilization system protein ParE
MVYDLLLTEQASDDATEAFDWYEEQLFGLGEDFYQHLLIAFDQISQYPNSGNNVQYGIRKLLVTTYPYAIYFSVKDKTVRVLRILHQSRHPDTWKKI